MASRHLFLFISYLIISISKGDELCNDYLLPSIPDTHITSSSSLVPRGGNAYTGPERGRLNTTQTTLSNGTILMGGWAPAADNKGQYIQATFDGLTYIEKIVTQGQTPGGGFVKLYKLEYTEDGKTWKPVVSSSLGVEQLFRGNDDADTPVEGELDCPVFAKGIRIIPLEWESHIALRFDAKGCYVDNSVIVTKPPPITTKVTTPSSTPVTTPTSSTPTTPITTSTPSTSTPSTRKTTKTTSVTTTPLTTLSSTTPPFLPGILTPFGGLPTTPITTLRTSTRNPVMTQGPTNPPTTTINLLTLIHWFLTALSNSSTTTAATTPLTTTSSTRPSTVLTTPTTTTPLTTTKSTTVKRTTTTPPFMPGIPNPFGTTKRP